MKSTAVLMIATFCVVALAGVVYAFGYNHYTTEAENKPDTRIIQIVEKKAAPPALPANALENVRSVGDPSAPVTMYEMSSLTCGHCAHFHTDTYPLLKKNYIDTGKLRLFMVDFPLNKPALDGAMIAHCLPEKSYFPYLQILFENQKKWAYAPDYPDTLERDARLAGLGPQQIKECLADEDLKNRIIDKIDIFSKAFDVHSTPTFVFNNGAEKLTGNQSYKTFKRVIDSLLEKAETTETPE